MALFLRSLLIAFAFLVACFIGTLVFAYGFFAPDLFQSTDPVARFFSFFLIITLTTAAGAVTPVSVFAPSFIAILIAEMLSLRSLVFYAIAGGLIGAVSYFMTDIGARMQGAGTVAPLMQELQWLTVAGIIAGFVYWAIAGRSAGKWKELP